MCGEVAAGKVVVDHEKEGTSMLNMRSPRKT